MALPPTNSLPQFAPPIEEQHFLPTRRVPEQPSLLVALLEEWLITGSKFVLSKPVTLAFSIASSYLSRYLSNPFGRAQILLQLQPSLEDSDKVDPDSFNSTLEALSYIYAIEGRAGFWRGGFVNAFYSVPLFCLRYLVRFLVQFGYARSLQSKGGSLCAHYLITFVLWPFEVAYVTTSTDIAKIPKEKRDRLRKQEEDEDDFFDEESEEDVDDESPLGALKRHFTAEGSIAHNMAKLYNGFLASTLSSLVELGWRELVLNRLLDKPLRKFLASVPRLIGPMRQVAIILLTTPVGYPFLTVARRQIFAADLSIKESTKIGLEDEDKVDAEESLLRRLWRTSPLGQVHTLIREEGVMALYAGMPSLLITRIISVGVSSAFDTVRYGAYIWTLPRPTKGNKL